MADEKKGKDMKVEFTDEEINKYIDMLGGGATKAVKITGPMRKMIKEAIEQGKNPNKVFAAIRDASPTVSGKVPVGEMVPPRGTPPPTLEDVEIASRAAAVLAGILGAAYLKNKPKESSASVEGDSSFDTLSYLRGSKQKLDQETVDAVKRIAEVISPNKTAGEVLLDIQKKAPDTFGGIFDEAVRETDLSRYKGADEVVGMFKKKTTPKADSKEEVSGAKKEESAKEQAKAVDYSPSNTAGVAIPEGTPPEVTRTEAETTPTGNKAEEQGAALAESASKPSGTPQLGGGSPTPKEVFNKEFDRLAAMDERMKKLEQFVQSLTGGRED